MINKRFFLETATLVVAAALCALVANAFASRERKLNIPGGSPIALSPVPGPRSLVPGPQSSVAKTEPPVSTPEITETSPGDPGPGTRDPGPATRKTEPARSPREFLPHPDKPWVEIDPAAVRELYARKVPFIDARRTNVYEEGHIAGARSIPVWESDLDDRLIALYNEGLDQEAPLVIYCSGGNCEDSHMLAQRLWGIGFNNVLVYKDGYPDWVKNRGPIATGPSR